MLQRASEHSDGSGAPQRAALNSGAVQSAALKSGAVQSAASAKQQQRRQQLPLQQENENISNGRCSDGKESKRVEFGSTEA